MKNGSYASKPEACHLWQRFENACVIAQECGNKAVQQEAFRMLRATIDKFLLNCELYIEEAQEIESTLRTIEILEQENSSKLVKHLVFIGKIGQIGQ